MHIEFEDENNARVEIPAWIASHETGDVVEEGKLVYLISFSVPEDPHNAPMFEHCARQWEFAADPNKPYSVGTVILELDPRYYIDDEGGKFSRILEQVEEEWWLKFAEHHYEYEYATMDEPGHWRAK